MPEPFIKTLDFEPEKTSSTPAETLNNTSGPGTSFGLGTYDEATNSYQGGLFDPDGFDYGAAFGGEPGQYIVTPNVIDTNPGGDDDNTPYNQTRAAYKKAISMGDEGVVGYGDYIRGRKDVNANYFVGGPSHEGLDPNLHDMDIYNQNLIGKKVEISPNYTVTLVGYTNENGIFQPLTHGNAQRALAFNAENPGYVQMEGQEVTPQKRDRGSPPGRSRGRPPRKKPSEEETETDTTLQPFTPVNTEFPEAVSNFAAPVQIRSGTGPNIVSTPFAPGESLLSQVGDLEMENTMKMFNRGGPVDRNRPPPASGNSLLTNAARLMGVAGPEETASTGAVFDTLHQASMGSQIGDTVTVDGNTYIKTAGEPDSGIISYLAPVDGGRGETPIDNAPPPPFIPGEQGVPGINNLPPQQLDRNRPPSGEGGSGEVGIYPPGPPPMYFYRPGVDGGQGSIFSTGGGMGRAKDDIELTAEQYNQIQNRGIENFQVIDGRLAPKPKRTRPPLTPVPLDEDTDPFGTSGFDPMNLDSASQGLGNIALQMATGILPYDVRYDVDGDGNITAAEALQIYKGEYDPFSYQAEGTGDTGGTGGTGTGSTGTGGTGAGGTGTGGTSTITTIMPTGYNAIVPQNITSTGMTPGNNLVNQIIPGTPYTYVNTPGGQMAVSPPSVSTFNPLSGGVNTYAGPTGLASLLSGDGSGSITASQPIYYSSSLYEPLPGLTTGQLLGLGTPSQADANALMKLLQNAQGTGTTSTTDTSGNTGV